MPRVSIILPAYNAEACLRQAVQSVLAQRFEDWELILVDDGSTDETPGICDGFAEADARIRVLHKQNGGVSAARNDGMDAARGTFVSFLDADDLYAPDYLSAMLDAMDETGADSALCGFCYTYPGGTRKDAPAPMCEGLHTPDETVMEFVMPLLNDRISASLTLGTVWRCLFRRETLRKYRLRFSGAYLEDELFLIEYFAHWQSVVCVDRPLYFYFQNPDSVTHRYLADFTQNFERTLDEKERLVERFSIPVNDDWQDNSAWAGLFIAVSNLYAPGAPGSVSSRAADVKALCSLPVFWHAYHCYTPTGMNRSKRVVAFLLRRKLFFVLSLLYTFKNRNR